MFGGCAPHAQPQAGLWRVRLLCAALGAPRRLTRAGGVAAALSRARPLFRSLHGRSSGALRGAPAIVAALGWRLRASRAAAGGPWSARLLIGDAGPRRRRRARAALLPVSYTAAALARCAVPRQLSQHPHCSHSTVSPSDSSSGFHRQRAVCA